MGVELEKSDSSWEKWATPEEIRYPHGVIPEGCCAAIRFEIRGWVAGEPRIILEHCNRVTRAAAPHWPKGKMAEHAGYRVHRAGDRAPRRGDERRESRRVPRDRDAGHPRHPCGVRGRAGPDLRAGPAADPRMGEPGRPQHRAQAIAHALGRTLVVALERPSERRPARAAQRQAMEQDQGRPRSSGSQVVDADAVGFADSGHAAALRPRCYHAGNSPVMRGQELCNHQS